MYSVRRTAALPAVGFPIRTSPDQSLVSGSPTLFAATHVLLRLQSPRHPSCTLSSLVNRIFLTSPSSPKTKVQHSRSLTGESTTEQPLHSRDFLFSLPCAYALFKDLAANGGADRDRTDDIQLAKLALSQLSYGPSILQVLGGPG